MGKKTILVLLIVWLTLGSANAQIAEVKISGGYAKIYDESGTYSVKSIWLGKNKIIRNVNVQYILAKDWNYVKYYDFMRRYTGKST